MKGLVFYTLISVCTLSCNYGDTVKAIKGHWIVFTQDEYYEVYSKSDGSYYLFDGVTGDYIEERKNKLGYNSRSSDSTITYNEIEVIRKMIFHNLLGIQDSMKLEEVTYTPELSFENFKVGSNRRFMIWLMKYKSSGEVGGIEKDLELELN